MTGRRDFLIGSLAAAGLAGCAGIAAGAEAFAKLFIEDVKARNLEVATLFQ